MPPFEPYPDRNPSLPTIGVPATYVDVFVDDFVGLAQKHKQRVRCTLLEAVMRFFSPCLLQTLPHNKSLSLSRSILEGGGSLSTIKLVLGWI
jgi:hypothetical protein